KLLTPKTKDIDLKFVFWLMQTINVDSTTHKRYYLSNYQHIKIPLPPLPTQQKIVSILEKAEKAKEWRKEADELTKDFLKSVFMEMFGDPITNNKKFTKEKISRGAKFQGGFAFKSKDYRDAGIKLVKITNVHYGFVNWDDITYVPEGYNVKYPEFLLKPGDIVMAMTRPIIKSLSTVKIIAIIENDLPALLNQRVGRFVINSKELNPTYLKHFCLTEFFLKEVDKFCSTSLQPNVSSKQIENIEILFPPIELQQKFAAIVERVEQIKEHQKQSKGRIDDLFNALMQKAFKGELAV
ncbi:restriction endonuclease subunit S, partial [archaeon]|nr:restriction endonuclease subunit S [Nanoarchaeota archaeon]MBU4452096.1 restriction endonuclease subunit S [Nanoarchaeota archaeon]MCG2723736.1 restriction endonuclease subunit S [archaeon]